MHAADTADYLTRGITYGRKSFIKLATGGRRGTDGVLQVFIVRIITR